MASHDQHGAKRATLAAALENDFINIPLDGCASGRKLNTNIQEFSDLDKGFELLQAYNVACSAGYDGMITVWIDDAGTYHGEFTRHQQELSRVSRVDKAGLKAWLEEWHPKVYEFS